MRLNIKKITAVATSVLMTGMTMGFAAAASFPTDFTSATPAIVYGNAADPSDLTQANSISNYLADKVPASGGTITGEKVAITQTSNKLNLNKGLKDVWGTSVTESHLPTLLAKGVYFNDKNTEYKYNQKFDFANLSFDHFSDSEYNDREPTLGFSLSANTHVANYTLEFTNKPESDHGTDLADFETTNIEILGKEYFILDFKNSTAKITLLDSAESTILSEGESTTLTVGGKTYDITISIFDTTNNKVKLLVNGESTNLLAAADTQKLSDGTYLGIKEVIANSYQGGSKQVEFSIGNGKLEITDSSNVKMNDKSIRDLTGYITLSNTASKRTWEKLVIEWRIEDKDFLTPGQELVMPGFEGIKFLMDETTFPAKEKTVVDYSSSDVIELKTTIKDGSITLPLIYISTTTGNISGIGRSATQKLATSNTTELIYNATPSSVSQYDGFIASWASTREAESYYLDLTVRQDNDAGKNYTTIRNKLTDDEWEDKDDASSVTIGNVILTINKVEYTPGGDRLVNMTINSGGSFKKLYTEEGLTTWLPWNAGNNSVIEKGAINLENVTIDPTITNGYDREKFVLEFSEQNKDGTIESNHFSMNLTGTSSKKVTVDAINADGGTFYETATSSKLWEAYVNSDLATKILWDKTNSDQYSAEITYHGDEVYANVFVAESGASSSSSGNMVFKDSEKTSWQSKNVIIVGGSCINTAAAEALGVGTSTCTTAFTQATGVGEGQYLIKSVSGTFATGKLALVVAGYSKSDTAAAVSKLIGEPSSIDTAAGNTYKGVVGVEGTSIITKQ